MKKPLRICVVSNETDLQGMLPGLTSDNHFQVETVPPASPQLLDNVPSIAEVVIVESGDAQVLGSQLPEWLAEHKGAAVYAVSDSAELDEVRKLMRAGVADVFVKPLQEDEIIREMEQVMDKRDAARTGGKLITFLNAKGGNGSTTMAVNTAVSLADDGEMQVLLIDLDIQFGDAAVALDLHPRSTVMEALSQAERLDETLLESLVATTDEGLHVLSSPARLDPLDSIRPRDVQKLLETALTCYDVVVVDLPRVVASWTNDVMRWSDHLFLVAQGSIASVRDSRLLHNHMHGLGVPDDAIHYIHNRAGAKHTAVATDQLQKALDSTRVVVIHNDYNDAIRAADMGKPVVIMAKSSPLAKDLRRLTEVVSSLCGHSHEKSGGLLGRIFGAGHGEK